METIPAPPEPPATRPARSRRWGPAIAVLGALVFLVFGGYVAAAALSTSTGRPVNVGGVALFRPLSGWRLVGRFDENGAPAARFTRGAGSFDVVALRFGGSTQDLAREYVQQVLDPAATQLSVSRTLDPVRLRSGQPAARFGYVGVFDRSGNSLEGQVTVIATGSEGVVVDAWAPQGQLQYVAPDVQTMIDEARIG